MGRARVHECWRRMSTTQSPGRRHMHVCMTGTGDTACCQIAATLQEQFGADYAGVWTGRLGRIACGDARPRARLLRDRKCSNNNDTRLLVEAVGKNCYRAIIQGFGGEKTLRAARSTCPSARVEPQAMPARGRETLALLTCIVALSEFLYAIRHPAACQGEGWRRKSLRSYCWLALRCTFVGNRTCPPVASKIIECAYAQKHVEATRS
jgi:hypothetical protein